VPLLAACSGFAVGLPGGLIGLGMILIGSALKLFEAGRATGDR